MKVIVNISYCAKAEVGHHVTMWLPKHCENITTISSSQVKGCDSALDLHFTWEPIVPLSDQVSPVSPDRRVEI